MEVKDQPAAISSEDAEEELEDSKAKEKCEGEAEQQQDDESVTSVTPENVKPLRTLVIIGDTNSIEIRSENILLDDQQTNVDQFSSRLYDLCGRHISVINLLGLQNIDTFPVKQGIHAFILLVPKGQHNKYYSSGVQWLEETFGKKSLSYLVTVVTHESDENCESAFKDLKVNSSFEEQRSQTCSRSMMNVNEIITLLEKIDTMVSDNNPQCYSQLMFDEHKEEKQDLDLKSQEEKNNSTVFQQNQTDLSCMSGKNYKQSVKISENINKKNTKETETLFIRLHLQDKLQQKLSPSDFLKIDLPVKLDNEISEKHLGHTFLKRIMMLDHRARYIPVRQINSKPVPVFDTVETDDNDLDDLFSTSVQTVQSKQTHVHPMDVQMAVFHCSDSFLKQNMVTKLSQCQYALPLLVPDLDSNDIECPLWTFRQINKTWKITQTKDNTNTVTMTMPICKAETPMVSFFRLGSLAVSKSQLINTLINDRHSTFFHRNCPGSTKSRILMDGVAEIAWYCPAGRLSDAFTDCVAFCNLHGDALLTEKQREILIEKSSVNVVFVPTLERSNESTTVITALYKSEKPLIILIDDNDNDTVQMKNGKYKIGLKDKNQSYVSEELKRIIGGIVFHPVTVFQLETMAVVSGIKVDENDTVCQQGKLAAEKIQDLFQWKMISEIQDEYLPCQGPLWKDWCRINKELYHLKGDIEKEKCKKEQELEQIRQDQCKVPCNELMKLFTESLSSLSSTEREYFLEWTQIFIDALFTDDQSINLQNYNEKLSEVLTRKKKHEKYDLKSKQIELEHVSKQLQSATFGLEHIFREMGQIYEAHKSLQKKTNNVQTDWSKYPELAADLMISGHPMELMDGDAGHVPLTWISRLLDEVIKKLGDQSVFVLSVLGLQSTGKSTMLNAMFGLQFAVSAGRCTRGAFMQLVKVSEEMKKDFDYVLVVDTEGLRPPQFEGKTTLHHDNELATFVVGLGNMTMINIFGENPAEMQDILQIVVQAFMRMKKVKLSPSCVFVHQNVTDVAAAEKNMDGKRCLQEKLDQMAQLAAKEEDCDAECFSDVIASDVKKDVKYFAQLWEGSPPMAPPNPGYSESVQELKTFIFSKASQSAGITLSQFKSKIEDLWNALMNENFVFSFKNTVEITVYRKLEVQYGNWTWSLRSHMLNIENQFYNRIENGKVDKVELSDLFNKISETYGEIKKNMTTFFDRDKDKEILLQWRVRFETKIKEFQDELVRGVKRKLDEVLQQGKACKKLDNQKTEFGNKLLQKSKELAQTLKDKAKDDEELKNQFNTVWRGWVSELTKDVKPVEYINFQEDQSKILEELGLEWNLIRDRHANGTYKDISDMKHYIDYVSKRTLLKKFILTNSLPHEEQELIRSFINKVEKESMEIFRSKPVATTGYSPTYLQEVSKSVKENVTEFQSQRKFDLKKEFTVDLLLYVFDRAESWILESDSKFRMKNDPHIYLESKKDHYYNIFRSFCRGASSAVVLGELIGEKLKVSTAESVCNKTAIDLAGEMRCSFPAFSENRLNLEKHVLTSLAEKEDFVGFLNYIKDPRSYVEYFIKEEVKKNIFTDHEDKALTILKKNVEGMKELVNQALFTATEKVKAQSGDTKMWLEEFSSLLKEKMKFDTICSQNFSDISDFDFLKKEVDKGLVSVISEMNSLLLYRMNEFRLQPDQILIDQLCNGCWVQCPFCSAVCTNTLEKHDGDHSVPFHRSPALNGLKYRNKKDLSIEFCTTKVASNRSFYPLRDSDKKVLYKNYRTAGDEFANWRITPDRSTFKYWKWVVCRFQTDLENYYNVKFEGHGEIPSEWRKHSKQDAIESLDEM